VIPWNDMDERERAVWSATVAAHFVSLRHLGLGEDKKAIEYATNLADRAVHVLRELAKKEPYR
jgi:hypothetical protein